jgi:60 kDa SS-A/Ro ribonucleoprotein
MIKANPSTVLNTVVSVSNEGRAYRNDAAIFVMALLLNEAPADFKQIVIDDIPQVVRIATHVYSLAAFIDGLGGWGRAKRKAIAKWFESKTGDQLAYQAVKYRQRNGWTLRDTMRLAHPKGIDPAVGDFILGKLGEDTRVPRIINGFNYMQGATEVKHVINFLKAYPNLPWEAIPTQFLKDPEVWKTLFANGQLQGQALVRNITRLSKIGAFNDMVFAREVADKLTDSDMIAKTRLHPIQFLLASVTHREGQLKRVNDGYGYWYSGGRERNWDIVPVIADALDAGFHKAFKAVEPAGKRTMLALDVSGSMSCDALGIDLSCAQVTAAMAMVTARVEPYYMIRGFSTNLIDLGITPNDNFSSVMTKVRNRNFGGTDASAAINWALENKVEIDTFQVYTDNETWAGSVHPFQALKAYRQKMGIDARLAVVGIAANDFSIADPSDRGGMMDFVGFDTNAPKVMADFSAGRL